MNYDEIKGQIDTFIKNNDPDIDTSDGTIVNLIVAGCAAAISGVYGYADMIGRKAFPDLCNFGDLKRWAQIKDVDFDESTPEDVLRQKVLSSFRVPPSGGDLQSFRNAIEKVSDVKGYSIFENERARGLGSVDIVLGHSSGQDAVSSVSGNIAIMRPLGCADLKVVRATPRFIELRIVCTGIVDATAVSGAVLRRFGAAADATGGDSRPGSDLFRSVIEAIAVQYGAHDASMFWRNAGTTPWIPGTCTAVREATVLNGVVLNYDHLVVTACLALPPHPQTSHPSAAFLTLGLDCNISFLYLSTTISCFFTNDI